jgi:hypothetical protein
MNTHTRMFAALAAVSLLSGCGGGGGNSGTVNHAFADIAVPTITAGSAFSFDLGTVVNGKYYLTDRNNKSVDVVDTVTLVLSQIKMISIPDAPTTYAVFINTNTNTVVARVNWIDTDGNPSGGNEQCQYDSAQQSFLVNNDSTLANPHGEIDVFPAASILALPAGSTTNFLTVAAMKRFPLGTCDPTGLALGPGTDAAVECRQGDVGAKLTTLIVNRTTGAIITTVPIGGGDQVAYDARTNKYFVAASRWHASGINELGGGCSATNICTPVLAVIDAGARALTATRDTGNNAHSVAVDPVGGEVFVPYSSAANPAGCGTCTANGFINGGISVFSF